jgi:hypothetical protein
MLRFIKHDHGGIPRLTAAPEGVIQRSGRSLSAPKPFKLDQFIVIEFEGDEWLTQGFQYAKIVLSPIELAGFRWRLNNSTRYRNGAWMCEHIWQCLLQ